MNENCYVPPSEPVMASNIISWVKHHAKSAESRYNKFVNELNEIAIQRRIDDAVKADRDKNYYSDDYGINGYGMQDTKEQQLRQQELLIYAEKEKAWTRWQNQVKMLEFIENQLGHIANKQ